MDGRFPPFDNRGRVPPQLNAAQMRAVLNLSSNQQGLSEAYYLQAAQEQQQRQLQQQRQHQLLLQQRQQQQQQLLQQQQQLRQQEIRDIQLRQLFLREQLSQQRRAIGDQLQDFPDLRQRYQNMLNDDFLQRPHQSLNGATVSGLIDATIEQTSIAEQQTAFLRERQLELRAYKEQLLLQEQQQLNVRKDEVVQSNVAKTLPNALLLPAIAAKMPPLLQQIDTTQRQISNNLISQNDLDISASKSPHPSGLSASAEEHVFNVNDTESSEGSIEEEVKPRKSRKRSNSEHGVEANSKSHGSKKYKTKNRKNKATNKSIDRKDSWQTESPSLCDSHEYHTDNVMNALAYAADVAYEDIENKGTITDLLDAAEENEYMESAAMILVDEIAEVQAWPESDDEKLDAIEEDDFDDCSIAGPEVPTSPAEQICLHNFKSSIPGLPEEPLIEDEVTIVSDPDLESDTKNREEAVITVSEIMAQKQSTKIKKSSINEFPYPIDTWWPSVGGMRRERKNCGETTDEDAFDEEPSPSGEKGVFRANQRKIKSRLSRLVQPGVLEKLPHCKIHRIKSKRKKNANSPELAYCWQVTELYPNDTMVNCSVCGTWRHIGCGGHYKPYSIREHTKTPFVAICENCHEEQQFLEEFPRGAKRVERQRAEQLRRGLASSTVMRYSSFSKHGGTYKWPLGSVSTSHIAGHTRSVQARHDKGEKQWNDMASRLYRGHGYRAKERVRSRTKELERLLVAIEDAEGYTDRHNMIVFLQRDTAKVKPAGFENEMKNIFDPADDDDDENVDQSTVSLLKEDQSSDDDDHTRLRSTISPTSAHKSNNVCARIGCNRPHRFDSRFCSDACGVSTLEISLMHAIQDASDLHPSVLRHS